MSNPYWRLFERTGLVESYLLYKYAGRTAKLASKAGEGARREFAEFGEEFARPKQGAGRADRPEGRTELSPPDASDA
ncbi:MAG: hypothetical protein BLITH_0936 [Brockia lithotrophica]|uniref:Uncharacterized protein n=1 Tax=Brockia lithotrophica TaxID=933949 RepID=A0A2T5G718_9BACL|nr:hypothetical protein [Brockia lithotrophica]PTQ51969.1 MAG: hypothetical protein BLITH_0936 [Brockia lithotrophica]